MYMHNRKGERKSVIQFLTYRITAVNYSILNPTLIFIDPDTDEMILLKCILKKEGWRVWPGLRWLRSGPLRTQY
jgi:hypothetical protein